MRQILLFTILILLVGCSKSNEEKLINKIEQLNNENSTVDVSIYTTDVTGGNGKLQTTIRNKNEETGGKIFSLIDNLFLLTELNDKPEMPQYYIGLYINAQRKQDLQTYKINLLVHPDLTYMKLLEVESYKEGIYKYDKNYSIPENLQKDLRNMLNAVSVSR